MPAPDAMPTQTPQPTAAPRGMQAFLRRHRVLLGVLLAHALLWSIVNAVLVPHPDYIDHWMQSRVLALSYFEHPPMVAWLIRATTAVFGSSETGMETAALVVNLLLLAAAYALAADLGGVPAGIFTLLALETTLFFVAKSSSIQTEQPLVLCWLLGLWALTRYLRTGRGRWLVLAGVAGGLGALSKYTMILFYLGWMAYVTIVPARRREWRNPWNYLAGLISFVLFLPVIYWNATHDWMSFRFQLSKSVGENAVLGLTPLIFVAGSLLTYSPVLSAWGYWRTLRRSWRDDGPGTLLIVMGWMAMLFFVAVLADATYSDPHWAVLSMVTMFVWLGSEAQRLWARGARRRILGLYLTAGALNVVVLGAIFVHIFAPWVRGQLGGDRGDDVLGWDRTAQLVEAELTRQHIAPPQYVVSFFYPLASHFALHMSSQPYSMSLERHQRNLWIDPTRLTPDNTLIVCQKLPHCLWIGADLQRYYGLRMGGPLGEVHQSIRGEERVIHLYALAAGVDAARSGAP